MHTTVRRVPCDGARPHCKNCTRRSTACVYDLDALRTSSNAAQPTSPVRDRHFTLSSDQTTVPLDKQSGAHEITKVSD